MQVTQTLFKGFPVSTRLAGSARIKEIKSLGTTGHVEKTHGLE
jgi:hypothetical protein